MSVLEKLIGKDFTLQRRGEKYLTTKEHDSLIIDLEKDIFYWNSKNIAGNAITWLTQIKGMSFSEARKFLSAFENYSDTIVYTIKDKTEEKDIIIYPKLVTIFWENGLTNREYWYNRLLTDNTINRFQLGFYNGWYAIPFFEDGTFKNFQLRREQPNKMIKSYYRGMGPLLFNSDILKIVEKVYITEGVVDAIFLNQIGYPAISHNIGAGWNHKSWYSYFLRQKEIIYIADNDAPGIKAAIKVANSLGKTRVKIATFKSYPDKCDTISFFRDYEGTQVEFESILNDAVYVEELLWKG